MALIKVILAKVNKGWKKAVEFRYEQPSGIPVIGSMQSDFVGRRRDHVECNRQWLHEYLVYLYMSYHSRLSLSCRWR